MGKLYARKLYSLGEVEGLVKRAAVGGGLSWGEAEELAKSVKFLSACDMLSFPLLVRYFEFFRRQGREGREGCPLAIGLQLSDSIFRLGDGKRLNHVIMPILILPILLRACNFHQINLHWSSGGREGWSSYIGGGKIYLQGDYNEWEIQESQISVVKHLPSELPAPLQPVRDDGIAIDDESNAVLWGYYMRTTVPESDLLRDRGAGSTKSDND